MRLSDLLIAANLVTREDVDNALARQGTHGGRLGDNLVEIGAVSREAIDNFLHRLPKEPTSVEETGLDAADLLSLVLKIMYNDRLETVGDVAEAIKLPFGIVNDLVRSAIDRGLLYALGARDGGRMNDMQYALTDGGRRWVQDALQQSQYVGPAPVTIEEFVARVHLQKVSNEPVTSKQILAAVASMNVDQAFIEKVGPALNSGRSMLLYGPPGNGKTSFAMCIANIFNDVIFVPYAVSIASQIMRVYDPSYHSLPETPATANAEASMSLIRRDDYDKRWVPCRRPFIVVGGELTLEMLDLRYDANSNFYEAPLHVKALGGCFVIDDFGRQLVSPTALLNRWIVPLESRVDFLKLHTGKNFTIPFEELIIFSTNLEPEELMDPAFLRRLPYKIEVGGPDRVRYRQILERICAPHGMTLSDDAFDYIVHKVTVDKGMELAAYHPRFIVDQVVATCRFLEEVPRFERHFIDYAVDNLRVRSKTQHAKA